MEIIGANNVESGSFAGALKGRQPRVEISSVIHENIALTEIMTKGKRVVTGKIEPHGEKTIWVTPALKIIVTGNIDAGTYLLNTEGRGTYHGNFEYYSRFFTIQAL